MAKKTNRRPAVTQSALLGKLMQKSNLAPQQPSVPMWEQEYKQIVALQQQNEVAQVLDRAITLNRNFPNIKSIQNLTAVLLAQNHRYQEALSVWESITEKDASILGNLGRTYQLFGNLEKAADYLQQALALSPNNVNALLNMGVVQSRMQNSVTACKYYEKVLAIDPSHAMALSNYLFNQYYLMPQSLEAILDISQRLGQVYIANNQLPHAAKPNHPSKPLHIGIVSADLHNHPVGFFAEGLFCSDAAKQFTWSVYANSDVSGELTERIRPHFQNWHVIDRWSDTRVVEQIRSDGIDILIDLSGHTGGSRMGIFAAQAAPLQISWLGYFGTTGLPTMQTVLADPYCVPPDEEKWFNEKIYRLPHTRLCMRPPEEVVIKPLPALENGYITFGCFQNLSKINESVLKVWAMVAKKIPSAHWFFQNSRLNERSKDAQMFRQKLQEYGFAEEKIHFSGSTPRVDYLNAYNQVDLVLDTFPYPGGTTTADALWMGVPTITFAQTGMLARQGEQLLSAAGLEEDWVCTRLDEYLLKAFYWADPAHWFELGELRLHLREQIRVSPLFDTERFARNWCEVVKQIWQEACSDEMVLSNKTV